MAKNKRLGSLSPSGRRTEPLESRRLFAAHIVGRGTSYSSIQAAVNAAATGATITVDAGSYAESVTVNKRLTIQGAGAGIDARGNRRRAAGAETTLTGASSGGVVHAAFYVTTGGVTIDGFVVQGVTDQSMSRGAGIVIAPNVSGTTVQNDIVQNNVAGLFLANNSSTAAAVIRHNVFRGNNKDGGNGGRAIYTDQTISGGRLTNVTIDGNAFFSNYGGSGTTHLEAAIAFESSSDRNSQTNLNVTNNVFDDDGKAVLAFNTDGLKFTGNVVTHGRDFYSGNVRFEGNAHHVTITGNNLYNGQGPAVAVDVKGAEGDSSGFVVTGNNIYGNGGVTTNPNNVGKKLGVVFNGDFYDGTFDARHNYWGSSTGPGGDGPGTGDSVYGGPGNADTGKWAVSSTRGTELYSGWATSPIVSRDTAYWGLAAADGYRIQAEDFDFGGNGVGYYDTTGGNSVGLDRVTDVDVDKTSDADGGYVVTNTAAGEWLDYAVTPTQAGTFRLDLRTASSAAGAKVRVLIDGQQVGSDVAVPSTGSQSKYTTFSLTGLRLTAAAHTLRLLFVSKNSAGLGPAFNWMQMTRTGTNPAGTSVATAPHAATPAVTVADAADWTDTFLATG